MTYIDDNIEIKLQQVARSSSFSLISYEEFVTDEVALLWHHPRLRQS